MLRERSSPSFAYFFGVVRGLVSISPDWPVRSATSLASARSSCAKRCPSPGGVFGDFGLLFSLEGPKSIFA
jgi:hypothetical protein